MALQNQFIHHVYFWLNDAGNANDLGALAEGLKKLSAVKTIKAFHIGRPADTYRGVIERSYSVSWMLLFDNAEDQASYQTDPIHLNFVDTCSHLWSKVVVYDSVGL